MAFTVSLPSAATLLPKMYLAVRHSPPGIKGLISGITMSATSDETTFPVAAPMMKPTARARTEFFRRNSRKPLIITTLPVQGILLQSGAFGRDPDSDNHEGNQKNRRVEITTERHRPRSTRRGITRPP